MNDLSNGCYFGEIYIIGVGIGVGKMDFLCV